MKIGQKLRQYEEAGSTYFSFEFFPPKTSAGVANLYDRVERLSKLEPAFIDITWGAGGSTADVTLDLATNFQSNLCLETQMHLTCTNMEVAKIDSALEKAKACGIQNILALRGDPPAGQERWQAVDGGFSFAVDLVRCMSTTARQVNLLSTSLFCAGAIHQAKARRFLRYRGCWVS
jgi:methylenetetrahydrofolate reductase (NADPH)